jgi:uncharacterized CHY-type Zn-finger protein
MIKVHGQLVDEQARCVHYRTDLDIVAIQFKCCGRYYGCYECHAEAESHDAMRWVADDLGRRALLCGACGSTLTIADYLGCDFTCSSCGSPFNPGCATHRDQYFNLLAGVARTRAPGRGARTRGPDAGPGGAPGPSHTVATSHTSPTGSSGSGRGPHRHGPRDHLSRISATYHGFWTRKTDQIST